MMVFDTPVWLIILAVVAYMAVGAAWYSPLLFAKPWLKAIGKTKDQLAGPNHAMIGTAVLEVIIVVGLAALVAGLQVTEPAAGAWLAVKVWLAFVVPTMVINRLFQGLNHRLLAIDAGYHLVGMLLAGAIVTL